MEIAKANPKPEETSTLWLIKAITGVLIVVILVIHFIVNHIIGENSLLTYQDIVRYYTNPIIPIMEIAFLIFVVSHSLIGLRGIILDLRPSRSTLKVLDWIFVIFGSAAVIYGIWLITVIVSRGASV